MSNLIKLIRLTVNDYSFGTFVVLYHCYTMPFLSSFASWKEGKNGILIGDVVSDFTSDTNASYVDITKNHFQGFYLCCTPSTYYVSMER